MTRSEPQRAAHARRSEWPAARRAVLTDALWQLAVPHEPLRCLDHLGALERDGADGHLAAVPALQPHLLVGPVALPGDGRGQQLQLPGQVQRPAERTLV